MLKVVLWRIIIFTPCLGLIPLFIFLIPTLLITDIISNKEHITKETILDILDLLWNPPE